MRVVKSSRIPPLKFTELHSGDVFRSRDEESVYMKTEHIDSEHINCVNLEDGEFGFLGSDDLVVKLNGYFVEE